MANLSKRIESLKGKLKSAKQIVEEDSPMPRPKKVVVVKKVAAKKNGGGAPRGPQEVPEGFVSVAQLAEEAEITPQSARVKLRASDIERPEGRWLWKAGSKQLQAARRVLGLG
jgi:hypothetical protein